MPTYVSTDREWHGPELFLRVHRALGRGLIGIGMVVVVAGKRNAHVISGTMRRSIHLAGTEYTGGNDDTAAQRGELASVTVPTADSPTSWAVQAGSWMPYACVEEVGRGHQFMTPALDDGRLAAFPIMRQAFAEEGLDV